MSQQVIDESRVLAVAFRALAVRDTRRLDDPVVAAQIVDKTDESLVQNLEFLVEDCLGLGYDAVRHP